MNYKLIITDTNIINIDILPGAKFGCKIYKGDGHYEYSCGTIMKCNGHLLLMLCNLLFFGYSDHSWDSIHYYSRRYNYYFNTIDTIENDLKIKGMPWYLDFEKYPDNFGLSPKLFVVTEVFFNNSCIYSSNYMIRKYKHSLNPNYIYEASENCKCFKYCAGSIFSSEKLEKKYAEVIPNKNYSYERDKRE